MVPVNPTFGTAAAQLVPLAQDVDENKVTPGLLGFVIFACIGLALWWLMKSMNKQFHKIDFKESTEIAVSAETPAEPSAEAAPKVGNGAAKGD